jgi:hypothetical protein
MSVGPPISLLTELNYEMTAAIAKVLPNTHHIFCENHILDAVKEELHGMFSEQYPFISELKKCIDGCRLERSFESGWNSAIMEHGFSNNELLQSL